MTTYGNHAANRLVSVNGVACSWDYNGNLLNDGTSTVAYDPQNRVEILTQAGYTHAFTYNGNGDGLTKSVNGVVTRYMLDINTSLTLVLSDGSFASLYGNDRLVQAGASETDYFPGDALGAAGRVASCE